jgi:hypothetical protein
MADWETWAVGVLKGIGAPLGTANADTTWAWSNAESGADVMRWNNPLNTSWYLPGAIAMNSIPVWKYATVQDGIDATVLTLLGGPRWPDPFPQYYPTILAHLRNSVPRGQWTDACPELGLWGTGCGWLQSTYGPVPGNLGGFLSASLKYTLVRLSNAAYAGPDPIPSDQDIVALGDTIKDDFSNVDTVLRAIQADAGAKPWQQIAADLKAGKYLTSDPDTAPSVPPGTKIAFTGTVTGSGTTT